MTPRMFGALLKRKERERLDIEFLFGQQASISVNHSMSPPKKAAVPADYMPSEILKKIERQRLGPTREERLAIDRQARAFFTELKKQIEEKSGATKVHHS